MWTCCRLASGIYVLKCEYFCRFLRNSLFCRWTKMKNTCPHYQVIYFPLQAQFNDFSVHDSDFLVSGFSDELLIVLENIFTTK